MSAFLKPPTNLQPPIAFLPHDPNRKLRHILPKPSTDSTRLQYVPLVDYSLPIVFVPTVNEAGNETSHDPVQTVPAQVQGSFQQGLMCQTTTKSTAQSTVVENASNSISSSRTSVENVTDFEVFESESFSGTPSEAITRQSPLCTPTLDLSRSKIASRIPKDTSLKRQRSPASTNSKRVPNILRRKKKRVKSPEKHAAIIQSPLKNSVQSTFGSNKLQ